MDSWWRGMERSTLNIAKGMMTHGRLAPHCFRRALLRGLAQEGERVRTQVELRSGLADVGRHGAISRVGGGCCS